MRGHDTSSEASADDFCGASRAVALPDQMREADAIELWRVTPQVRVQFLWVRAARRQRPAETTNPADAALVLTMWPYRVAQAVRQRRDALVAAKGGGGSSGDRDVESRAGDSVRWLIAHTGRWDIDCHTERGKTSAHRLRRRLAWPRPGAIALLVLEGLGELFLNQLRPLCMAALHKGHDRPFGPCLRQTQLQLVPAVAV